MALRQLLAAPAALVQAMRGQWAGNFARTLADNSDSAAGADRSAASWDEACERVEGGYHTPGLTRFRVARARLHVPDGSLLLSNVLSLAARLVGRPDMAVTDFGGSTGEMGADFLIVWPAATYCVVENPRLVAGMHREAMRQGVLFSTEMPAQCDIFYCSGALQYLAEPLEIWNRGLMSARHCAVLRRNYFADEEEFDIQTSRLFHNGHGPVPDGFDDFQLAYPRRTLIETQLHALARHHGFTCIANLDDPEDADPGRYSRQLVFWRDAVSSPPPRRELGMRLARLARAMRPRP
jgi:putative methyltransferase (TIGR04325 family)